jgi:hypothetical protein
MSILKMFDLDADNYNIIAEDPTAFEKKRDTVNLVVGKEVSYNASIAGKQIPAFVTLESARLTRLSLLDQKTANGDQYWLATGIFNPVKLNIELLIDGNRMNIIDLLHAIINESSNTPDRTREQAISDLRNMGLNFTDGSPLFFQQMGANEENFQNAINAFKEAGATDDMGRMQLNASKQLDTFGNPKTTGRIEVAYTLKSGVEVTSFELGKVNRLMSSRSREGYANQGFINLADAIFEQFTRASKLAKQKQLLKSVPENNMEGWTQAQIKSANGKIDAQILVIEQMQKQLGSNWAGTQNRVVKLPNGKFEEKAQLDPVSAPCGRFTMVIDDKPMDVDLWTNKLTGTPTTAVEPVALKEIMDGF